MNLYQDHLLRYANENETESGISETNLVEVDRTELIYMDKFSKMDK